MKTTKFQLQLKRLNDMYNFKTQKESAKALGISDRHYRRIKKSGEATTTLRKLIYELLGGRNDTTRTK